MDLYIYFIVWVKWFKIDDDDGTVRTNYATQ